MRRTALRAQKLLDRYRVDRRLPPETRELYDDVVRLRLADEAQMRIGSARPVLGRENEGPIARLGAHRVVTAGQLDRPMAEVAVDVADAVSTALQAARLDPWVVSADPRVTVGVDLAHRGAALEALRQFEDEAGWYLEWFDRGASGVVPLGAVNPSHRAARSREWSVFRAYDVGGSATGAELGVVVSFWTPGPSGQLERVGTRGQARFDSRSERTVEKLDGRSFPGRSAFPVERSLDRMSEPVDVVYTWVDGSDPEWLDSFRSTAHEQGRRIDEANLDPARYRSRDELRYSLRSLWMFCGWVRRIFVVTAGQRPAWLVDGRGVTVIDHSEIMPASALPTFNSHAIEASLHRIEGLSEHFIYFNDDMLITRPLRPESFFHPNGLPYWFPSDARVPGVEDATTQAVDTAALRGRELLRERFDRVAEYKPLHSPYPLLRSVGHELDAEYPEVMDQTRHSRFRAPTDISVAASFAQHYAFATGRSVRGSINSEYVHVESRRLAWHLDRIRLDPDIQTCCINETELEDDGDGREAKIREFFETKYPIPAPWERSEA